MNPRNLIGLFVLILAVAGCGVVDRVANTVTDSGTTTTELWADVPAFPGATKSDATLPFLVRKIIETVIVSSADQQGGGDFQLEGFDFIGYSTDRQPNEIEKFYTKELMTSNGWNAQSQPGCDAGTETPMEGAAFCMFAKRDGNRVTMIAIIANAPQQNTPGSIYYVRAAGIDNKQGNANQTEGTY